jgi:chromosome segregation ATPase
MFQATRIAYGARRFRVVTLNGEMIETSGAMSGGGKEKMHGKMGTQASNQGCQIVLGTTYQNWEIDTKISSEYTKLSQNLPNHSKKRRNIPKIYQHLQAKIYPNWHFWFENIPSGNTARNHFM